MENQELRKEILRISFEKILKLLEEKNLSNDELKELFEEILNDLKHANGYTVEPEDNFVQTLYGPPMTR